MLIFQKEFKSDTNNEQTGDIPKTVAQNIPNVGLENQKLFQEKLQKMLSSLGQYLDPHWGADIFYGKNFIAERLPPTQGEAVLTIE